LSGEAGLEIIGQAGAAPVAVAEMIDRMPHVAIVDISLAQGTGFDVLRGLASQGDVRPVVVMLSNYSSQRYRDEARQLGIVDGVVAREKLEGRAEALAVKVARAGREAVAQTKVLLAPGAGIHDHEGSFAALWDAKLSV